MNSKNKILIIEDDQTVNYLLSKNLVELGYEVDVAYDGEDGLTMALAEEYQIILLDVMIPKLDGFQVLEKLRTRKLTPVVMLTAKGGEEDRICGFKTGADDYLSKPFNMAELELRIQAILRRTQMVPDTRSNAFNGSDSSQGLSDESKLFDSSIRFNKKEGLVIIQDQDIPFTPLEFNLLYTLVENQGDVLSKPQLYQRVLSREFSRYDRTLDMHISKIRKKITLAGMAVNTIKTVHGQGYCFEE